MEVRPVVEVEVVIVIVVVVVVVVEPMTDRGFGPSSRLRWLCRRRSFAGGVLETWGALNPINP